MTDRAAFEAAWPGDYRPLAWEIWQTAAAQEREACVAILEKWSDASHLTLHAGEMTAQELRTVQAVVNGIKADIRGAK